MTIDKFLIINSRGTITIREREPRLAGDEIALRLKLWVPNEMFKRPILLAEMSIPNEAIPKGTVTPEIATNVEKLIKEATGLTMNVSIVEHNEKENV